MNFFFSILLYCTIILTGNSFASDQHTLEEANSLYAQRDATEVGIRFAEQAASAFAQLAKNENDLEKKAELLISQSMSLYFVADHQTTNQSKKLFHHEGYEAARIAMNLISSGIGKPTKEEYKKTLAKAYYWYGANLARWGEANGVVNSLKQWPTLKSYMISIRKMEQGPVEAFGANRILGRAFYKLPFPMGSKKKSLHYLKEAFENTLHPVYQISNYAVNNLFYAETLISVGKSSDAKKILNKLIEVDSAGDYLNYNAGRIPETKEEIREAKELLKKL